jgi:hypothetical protein
MSVEHSYLYLLLSFPILFICPSYTHSSPPSILSPIYVKTVELNNTKTFWWRRTKLAKRAVLRALYYRVSETSSRVGLALCTETFGGKIKLWSASSGAYAVNTIHKLFNNNLNFLHQYFMMTELQIRFRHCLTTFPSRSASSVCAKAKKQRPVKTKHKHIHESTSLSYRMPRSGRLTINAIC